MDTQTNSSQTKASSTSSAIPPSANNRLPEQKASSSPTKEPPLAEIISQKFPSFNAESLVVSPFQDQAVEDAKFEQELSAMMLDVMLEMHAWSSARPKHEAALASQQLEGQISQIMETERQQGMCSPTPSYPSSSSSLRCRIVEQTRAMLGEFVQRMKTALAALTGNPF